jgi:hypothetical protein
MLTADYIHIATGTATDSESNSPICQNPFWNTGEGTCPVIDPLHSDADGEACSTEKRHETT